MFSHEDSFIDLLIHPFYSDKFYDINLEEAVAPTHSYWELILSIGRDGITKIIDEYGMMLLHYEPISRLSKAMI